MLIPTIMINQIIYETVLKHTMQYHVQIVSYGTFFFH